MTSACWCDRLLQNVHPSQPYQELRSAGYAIQAKAYYSSRFGLPQSRHRAWAVIMDMRFFGLSGDEADSIFGSIFGVVDSLQCEPRPLEDFLVDNTREP